jgi:hypothetical protein
MRYIIQLFFFLGVSELFVVNAGHLMKFPKITLLWVIAVLLMAIILSVYKKLDELPLNKILEVWFEVIAVMLGIGIMAFYAIMPVYLLMGWHFYSLGPIVTAGTALLFDVYFVTPIFVIVLLIKLIRETQKRAV